MYGIVPRACGSFSGTGIGGRWPTWLVYCIGLGALGYLVALV